MRGKELDVDDYELDAAGSVPCGRSPPMKLANNVKAAPKWRGIGLEVRSHAMNSGDWRLERLIERLPSRLRVTIRWLRQPSSVWVRMTAGALLTCGGLLGFLPILGFWMFPIGLMLLADDVSPLRSLRSRILDWIERRRPHWVAD